MSNKTLIKMQNFINIITVFQYPMQNVSVRGGEGGGKQMPLQQWDVKLEPLCAVLHGLVFWQSSQISTYKSFYTWFDKETSKVIACTRIAAACAYRYLGLT